MYSKVDLVDAEKTFLINKRIFELWSRSTYILHENCMWNKILARYFFAFQKSTLYSGSPFSIISCVNLTTEWKSEGFNTKHDEIYLSCNWTV